MRLQAQFAQRAVANGGMPGMPYGMPPGRARCHVGGQPPPASWARPSPSAGFGFQPIMPPARPPHGPRRTHAVRQHAHAPARRACPASAVAAVAAVPRAVVGAAPNMRGFNQNMPPAPPAPNMPPARRPHAGRAARGTQLPNASADQQRMLLGEALYPLVDAVEPASSAKITGMLLEMDQSEVLHLIEDSKALSDKVQEAVAVLKAAAAEDA